MADVLEKLCEHISIFVPCHHTGLLCTFFPPTPPILQAKASVKNMQLNVFLYFHILKVSREKAWFTRTASDTKWAPSVGEHFSTGHT